MPLPRAPSFTAPVVQVQPEIPRDQQVMKELHEILTKADEDIDVKAYKFVNILHLLSQEVVSAYIFA